MYSDTESLNTQQGRCNLLLESQDSTFGFPPVTVSNAQAGTVFSNVPTVSCAADTEKCLLCTSAKLNYNNKSEADQS